MVYPVGQKIMMRAAYGDALVAIGEKNPNIVVLDADLAKATFTETFAKKFSQRFVDVGIAEANLITTSVGMSLNGFIPFCSTFALFGAGRAYEQIRNSVAYPHANVKICCTHGGITVGPDGGSHQSIEDFALMRVIPDMTVIIPSDANQVYKVIQAVSEFYGPVYMRIGRSPSEVLPEQGFMIGKANILREGKDVALVACGIMVPEALECARILKEQGVSASVINMHTLKPLDTKVIAQYASICGKIVTMEEHSVIGGLGDAVGSCLHEQGSLCRLLKIGIQDRFGQSGDPAELMEAYGLTGAQAADQVMAWIKRGLKGHV